MLRELDVDFEYVNVDPMKGEHHRPEFLALNPAGKLPVLVDDDFVLNESVAIVLYLAEKTWPRSWRSTSRRVRRAPHRVRSAPPRRRGPKCSSTDLALTALSRDCCYAVWMLSPNARKAEVAVVDGGDPVDEAFQNAPLDDMPETDAERAMMAEARAEPAAWVSNEDHQAALAARTLRER